MRSLFLSCAILLLSLFLNAAKVEGKPNREQKIVDKLLRRYPGTDARPVKNSTDQMSVVVNYELKNIVDFDQQNDIVTMVGWLTLSWVDEFLILDPSEAPASDGYGDVYSGYVTVPMESVFTPDITAYDAIDQAVNIQPSRVAVTLRNGGCSLVRQMKYKIQNCTRTAKWTEKHPEYDCELKLGSWYYNGERMYLKNQDDESSWDMNSAREGPWSPTWTISELRSEVVDMYYDCCPELYQEYVFYFKITRKRV